ncbi:phage tail tip lysozyme [Rhizobium sp. NXC24]|uniref:phage tail tip lysozyme n=1 Tax=Rhizobium sp. NXC24 TaxID=2048897 RepID=UPI000CDF4FBF|nr:phage tail tip lysozyme [Rhizobium sp. NXC24]AVA20677.1 hypothetical protein NXC24_CH01010 [Rhizobium sp. NXC24]
MAIANLRVPIAALPTADTSWLKTLQDSAGNALDTAAQNKAFEQNVIPAITGTAAPQQQPGFLGRLFGAKSVPAPAAQQQIAATNPAPVQGNVSAGTPNDIQNQFIDTVRSGGLTNPYGLAAVAATGRAESGWSPANVNAAWPDPSQSGQAGTAGGILSWRNERLANLRNFAQSQGEDPSNISPATQAKFFLQEDPTLVQRLNAAKSPQEAANIMANAWKFRGYDQAGGEAARRAALTQNYYSTQFANAQPQTAAPAAPTQVASLDPSIGILGPGAAAQMRATNPAPQAVPTATNFDPSTVTPDQMNALLGLVTANPGYVDPMVTTAYRQPAQTAASAPVNPPPQATQPATAPTANAGANMIAAAQPATRQNVTNDQIAAMVRNPYTRQVGLQLWQQVLTGKMAQPWSFVKLDDGTLARANASTGEVQSLGKFGSAKKELLSNGKGAFYDAESGQWIAPPEGMVGATEYGLAPIYGTDANGNTVIGQLAKDGTFQQTRLPAGFVPTPGVTSTDLGTSVITRNNKTGQIVDTQAKDVQGEAFQKKVGTDTGEQQANRIAAGSSLGSTLSSLDRLDAAANELSKDPDLGRVTGWSGLLPNVPGGKGASVQARLNTLKSQIGFSVLQAMRDASKTGGALGAISDKENELLQNNLASLSQAQSEEDLKAQLGRIRDYVAGAKARLSGAYKQMYGEDYQSPSVAPASGNTTSSGVKWSIEK